MTVHCSLHLPCFVSCLPTVDVHQHTAGSCRCTCVPQTPSGPWHASRRRLVPDGSDLLADSCTKTLLICTHTNGIIVVGRLTVFIPAFFSSWLILKKKPQTIFNCVGSVLIPKFINALQQRHTSLTVAWKDVVDCEKHPSVLWQKIKHLQTGQNGFPLSWQSIQAHFRTFDGVAKHYTDFNSIEINCISCTMCIFETWICKQWTEKGPYQIVSDITKMPIFLELEYKTFHVKVFLPT